MNLLVSAIKDGFEEKALSILKVSDSNLSIRNYLKLMDMAFEFGTAKILYWLINSSQHRFDLMNINWKSKFGNAIEKGYSEIVISLISDKRVDPSGHNNIAIGLAGYHGHLEITKLLLQDKRVDPSADNNFAIRYASQNGHTDIVNILLQDKSVDPSDDNNYAIRWTSYNGHLEIIKLLLQDKRVDPSADDNKAIRFASKNEHLEIVKLLEDVGCKLDS